MCRAPGVPQRTANDGHERAATVTRTLSRSNGGRRLAWSQAHWLLVDLWSGAGSNRRPSAFQGGRLLPLAEASVADEHPLRGPDVDQAARRGLACQGSGTADLQPPEP